eukprot:10020937-Karenia_brevis.AAC.1
MEDIVPRPCHHNGLARPVFISGGQAIHCGPISKKTTQLQCKILLAPHQGLQRIRPRTRARESFQQCLKDSTG